MWNILSCSYLLLASEQILNELHGALRNWWQVQLTLLGQDVEQVKLALHCALELAARHGHFFWSVVDPIADSTNASTSGILNVLLQVVIDELVRVSLPEVELSLWET